MKVAPGSALGISSGAGMVTFVLATVDGAGHLHTDCRFIEVDSTGRFDRPGPINSMIRLLHAAADAAGTPIQTIGASARCDDTRRSITERGSGPRRELYLFSDTEAVAHALVVDGHLERHDRVIVVDCGDTGMSLYTVDRATEAVGHLTRSQSISGYAVDSALADEVRSSTDIAASGPAWDALISRCRTAKEELAESESSQFTVDGIGCSLSRMQIDKVVAPMAQAAVARLQRFRADHQLADSIPVVLVGGLANLCLLQKEFRSIASVIVPPNPQLCSAVGAALLSRPGRQSVRPIAYIGGSRHRELVAVLPIVGGSVAVAGFVAAVFVMISMAGGPATSELDSCSQPRDSGASMSNSVPTSSGQVDSTPPNFGYVELPPVPAPPLMSAPQSEPLEFGQPRLGVASSVQDSPTLQPGP